MPTVNLSNVRGEAVSATRLEELHYWLRRNFKPTTGTVADALTAFTGRPAEPPALETAPGAVVVIHGSNAAQSRPATTQPVIWYGTVQPTAFSDGDVFVPVAAG